MTGADGIGPQLSRAAMAAVGLALLLLTGACASPFERPAPFDDEPLRARAVTKTDDGIRVSAAVPSGDESRSIFGVDLDQRGIQPLWLEIENGSERSVYFLPTGLDPEYFAPLEVAFLYGGPFHDEGKAALAEHLEALSFDSRSPIASRGDGLGLRLRESGRPQHDGPGRPDRARMERQHRPCGASAGNRGGAAANGCAERAVY